MKGNNVRIEQENLNTARVFIDGNEVKGVVKLEFTPETLNFNRESGKEED